MDKFVYNALSSYYHVLEKTGYISYANMQKLLILAFYKDFTEGDYRGILSCDDYKLIERALNCLYGSSCLIPYPDYLKMGKLCLGDTSELAWRVRDIENHGAGAVDVRELTRRVDALENTDILQLDDTSISTDSDILVTVED